MSKVNQISLGSPCFITELVHNKEICGFIHQVLNENEILIQLPDGTSNNLYSIDKVTIIRNTSSQNKSQLESKDLIPLIVKQNKFYFDFNNILFKSDFYNSRIQYKGLFYICPFSLHLYGKKLEGSISRPDCGPPGKLIFCNDRVTLYEVPGTKKKYCKNLCMISNMFMQCKTDKVSDLKSWMFYALYENHNSSKAFVGYFSKNLTAIHKSMSCIMILPGYRQRGYSHLLISISYSLIQREQLVASPEEPLSRLGELSFLRFWTNTLMGLIINFDYGNGNLLTFEYLKKNTMFTNKNMLQALCEMGILYESCGSLKIEISSENLQFFHKSYKRQCNTEIIT